MLDGREVLLQIGRGGNHCGSDRSKKATIALGLGLVKM